MERRRNELEESLGGVDHQTAALEAARDALHQKVEQFRVRKVEMDARLAAADAQIRLREVMASAPGDVAAVTRAQERLGEHVEAMRAQAAALGELTLRSGDVGTQPHPLEREIRDLERARRLELELERIKQEALAEEGITAADEGKEETGDDV
jgi:phage shock protein A